MQIEFNEKDHIYIIDGDVASTSVTKLLAKHKLTNDYSGVDKKVLENKANYGTTIHKDIEKILTEKGYEPQTKEGILFREYALKEMSGAIAEQLVGINYNGLTIGGSIDVLGFMKDGTPLIADHKTYATMNNKTLKHISWQLSIYDYMARHIRDINGVNLCWLGARIFKVFWYKKDKDTKEISLEVLDVEKIPDEEIENLFNCEIQGKTYQPRELVITKELSLKMQEAEIELAKKELEIKQYKDAVDQYRSQIKEMMREQHILNWKSPNGIVSISYTSAYTKDSIDSKKLKKERPDIYKDYLKTTNVSDSIKVSVDEVKLEELLENESIPSLEHKATSVENE